jgi:hypothetical protein
LDELRLRGVFQGAEEGTARLDYTSTMDSLFLCTFAVGSADGPRSSTFGVSLARDRPELRLSARTQASRWEMTIQVSGGAAGAGGQAPPTKEGVRQAVFDGAWIGEGGLAVAWPGHQVAPGIRRQLSLYVSGSALRKLEPPAGEPEPRWIAPPEGFGQIMLSVLVATAAGSPAGSPAASSETIAGTDEQLLGQGVLSDGRNVWVCSRREEITSPLRKAGLFTALRKRPAPGISQEAAWREGTRVLFACELHGAGLVVELPGDLFRTPGAC